MSVDHFTVFEQLENALKDRKSFILITSKDDGSVSCAIAGDAIMLNHMVTCAGHQVYMAMVNAEKGEQ